MKWILVLLSVTHGGDVKMKITTVGDRQECVDFIAAIKKTPPTFGAMEFAFCIEKE